MHRLRLMKRERTRATPKKSFERQLRNVLAKKSKNAEYRPVLHVCSNRNICERLFSGNKLVMSDQRKCVDPSTLETVTVLDENSDLWDARDVQEFALAAKRNGELQDEDFLMAAYESDCSDDEDDDAVVIDLAVDINLANA